MGMLLLRLEYCGQEANKFVFLLRLWKNSYLRYHLLGHWCGLEPQVRPKSSATERLLTHHAIVQRILHHRLEQFF